VGSAQLSENATGGARSKRLGEGDDWRATGARRQNPLVSDATRTPDLLGAPDERQQRFIDIVGEIFRREPGVWPIFDYVEGVLDEERIDAGEILNSFPELNLGGSYSAVWCPHPPGGQPHDVTPVALTIVGIHHCRPLAANFPASRSLPQIDLVRAFVELLDHVARRRRGEPPNPTKARANTMTSDEILGALALKGHRFDQLNVPRLLYDLMDHEPAFWAGGGSANDTGWSRGIPRGILDFEGVIDLADYVTRLELREPPPWRPTPAGPSPLGLVAAIDYIDTVWQLVHKGEHLFRLDGAERVAKLALPAQTSEEFDSRLSGLSELLRSMRAAVPTSPSRKGGRDRPLAVLETYLVQLLDPSSESRIRSNVATLERVVAVRDAGQHGPAGRRAALGLGDLGIGFPVADWSAAWTAIQTATIEALGALREELRAHAI
jgi:hypothetical protein